MVPQHFWLEVANRIGREAGWQGAVVIGAIHRLDTYDLATIDADRPILLRVIDLVERFRLTAYDALYLAIADILDAELATFDDALIAAGSERTATLIDDHRLHEPPAPYEREVTWPRYREVSAYLAKLRAEALRGGERDRGAPAPASVYERESPSAVPGPRR